MNKTGRVVFIVLSLASIFLLVYYNFTSFDINVMGRLLSITGILSFMYFAYLIYRNEVQKALLPAMIFTGIIFIFSGFVKAVDPMGSIIKIGDYLNAFRWDFLKPLTVVLAFILCCYEFPLGVAIFSGWKARLMSWLLFLIMLPFTFLTLYLAIKNPVTDCGCFGDALILSNWETFFKNLIILIYVIYILVYRNQIRPLWLNHYQGTGIFSSLFLILVFSVYNYMYLPVIDFRPYKVGKDIYQQMIIPEGEQGDVYETVLIYKNKKNGQLKEFDIDHIPMDDNWEWVETKNKLVRKGYHPPIHDFKIMDREGNDITQMFLQEEGYRLVIVQEQLSRSWLKAQDYLNRLVNDLKQGGDIKVWAFTSSLKEEQDTFISRYHLPYTFYNVDATALKTMIRSNPGLLLFKDNVILKKWPARSIPSAEEIYQLVFRK